MTSVVMCACGIAKDDCDYHKPEQQDYIIGPVFDDVWLPNIPIQDNPFKTNDMSKRARFMLHHPNLVDKALREAGLNTPWELNKL